jgi:hypothetical protein
MQKELWLFQPKRMKLKLILHLQLQKVKKEWKGKMPISNTYNTPGVTVIATIYLQ